MEKKSAKEVLEYMIGKLTLCLEELSGFGEEDAFEYGEKTAYIECLEWIEHWDSAEENGLDFDIEKKYPL